MQDKKFDLDSTDPRRSPMGKNLWLKTNQLKHIY